MRRLLLWVTLGVILWATSARSQTRITITQNTIGVTWCENGLGRSMIDAEVVGTDSLAEVLVHEKAHRDQIARRSGLTGVCIPITTEEALYAEVEAYCVSRVERRKQYALSDVDDSYLRRLLFQFWAELPVMTIVEAYRLGCVRK